MRVVVVSGTELHSSQGWLALSGVPPSRLPTSPMKMRLLPGSRARVQGLRRPLAHRRFSTALLLAKSGLPAAGVPSGLRRSSLPAVWVLFWALAGVLFSPVATY